MNEEKMSKVKELESMLSDLWNAGANAGWNDFVDDEYDIDRELRINKIIEFVNCNYNERD